MPFTVTPVSLPVELIIAPLTVVSGLVIVSPSEGEAMNMVIDGVISAIEAFPYVRLLNLPAQAFLIFSIPGFHSL
ncbi:MAG: hypothetical protein WA126_07290 [Thermodesulfovibrionales bacterium]